MKQMLNKVGIVLASILLIQMSIVTSIAGATVFSNVVQETKVEVSPDVTHIQRTFKPSSSVRQYMNVLDVKLTNAYTNIEVGIPNPINKLMTTSALATQQSTAGHRVVGAVNAAFFLGNGMPANLLAQNNEIINYGILGTSSESPTQQRVAFGISKTGRAMADYYNPNLTYTINGKTYPINYINGERPSGASTLYTPEKTATGTNEWGIEIVVAGASQNTNALHFGDQITGTVVTSTAFQQPGNSSIPQDGFVISVASKAIADEIGNIEPGTEVTVNLGIEEKWMDAQFILAAGPLLVKNGQVNISMPTNSSFASSLQPRTAVAVDATGTRVFLVTVDGRQAHSDGTGLNDLANYLIKMGAASAINLDGGGSTTMVVRNPGGYALNLMNKPSDGSERRVSAILQVVNTAPAGSLKAMRIAASSSDVVVGSSAQLSVANAYDQYLNPVEVNPSNVKWSVEGGIGTINGTTFTATAKGTGKIVGEYQGLRTSFELNVIELSDTVLLSSFDQASAWGVETAKATAAISNSTSAEPYRQGTSSIKLAYNFTTSETGTKAAYVVASKAIPMTGRPDHIGMWVYGDSAKHWLRGVLIDAAGTKHTIDFTEQGGLNWSGWKYVKANVPANAMAPLKFDRAYIVQPTASLQNKGVLYFDKLQAVYARDYVEPLYTDVAKSHWASLAIASLNAKRLVSGYTDGTYKPNQSITRAEAAVIIARALNLSSKTTLSFKDVSTSHYASASISAVASKGIMSGRPTGEFDANGQLTRAEMATILTKAYNLSGTASISFKDVKSSHWSYQYIQALVANKLTSGYPDNTFKPNEQITRAQFASFLNNCLSQNNVQ